MKKFSLVFQNGAWVVMEHPLAYADIGWSIFSAPSFEACVAFIAGSTGRPVRIRLELE